MSKFCILGYIFNDVTLKSAVTPLIKMRLGGIVHAARVCMQLAKNIALHILLLLI